MKITIDSEKCIGCGTCVAVCPECFTLNGGNKASVLESCDCEAHAEKINQAKDACPVQAIVVD